MLGDKTLRLLDGLDDVVLEAEGALYPAKDARMEANSLFCISSLAMGKFMNYRDNTMASGFQARLIPH